MIRKQLQGGLVVSCQALPHEPLHGSHHMATMARTAKEGGACGIRANGSEDIQAIRAAVELPIIGLWKKDYEGFQMYITPTVADRRSRGGRRYRRLGCDRTPHTVRQQSQALEAGADFVVIGSAITMPQWITARFADALRNREAGR